MKLIRRTAWTVALATVAMTQTGCFGTFALTREVYAYHDSVTNNKFVKSLLYWIPGGLVYAIAVTVDTIVLNLIEFWTGTNPISMNEGDHEMQLATIKGVHYRIDATKDTFTTTQLSGDDAGEVRIMKFDRNTLTWKYTDSEVCEQPVMTFLDERAENVRVYTTNGTMDLATSDLQNKDLLLAKFNADKGLATAN
jgi:hypothetical protein